MIDVYMLRKMLANRQFGENITISKWNMPKIPRECRETLLGDPEGAYKQYRCDPNIHILEYPDRYKVHKDRVDPGRDPLGHLICDSPETLPALGVAGTSGTVAGKIIYDKRKNKSKNATREAVIGGILTAIITGISTYYLGKGLKNMYFEIGEEK